MRLTCEILGFYVGIFWFSTENSCFLLVFFCGVNVAVLLFFVFRFFCFVVLWWMFGGFEWFWLFGCFWVGGVWFVGWLVWLCCVVLGLFVVCLGERFLVVVCVVFVVVVMRFLVVQRVRREVPLEKWAKLLPLQFKYFDGLEREKVLEVCYHLVGQQGSMLVVNVSSDEDLSRVIGDDPMFFECEREVYPLTSRKTMEKHLARFLKP